MLISLNWIKEFAKIPDLNPDELANTFTMKTAEVENTIKVNEHLEKILAVEIISIRKHPEADKLNLVTIDCGNENSMEVVCGASNVREGLKVPYAPVGVTLPNGLTLAAKKVRGILSEGMLCSASEVSIDSESGGSDGLLELNKHIESGTNLLQALNLSSDTILDVDNKSLTHRPDLWGHFGLAREFALAFNQELIDKFDNTWVSRIESSFTNEASPIKPQLNGETSCLNYWGLSVDNVKVTESPAWISKRLEDLGLRSINNIVDISNYVMLELGIPLHIYDRDKIENNIITISKLDREIEFETLDEVQRKLIPGDTVISDSQKPLVLAGVMGGLNSGVDETTSRVFIEVANWKATAVRTTSTRLGLRTDSSTRYEKTLDGHQCYKTLLRALEVLQELCPSCMVVGRPEYAGQDLSEKKSLTIKTSYKRICGMLGTDISDERINQIFEGLGFTVKLSASENTHSRKNLEVSVPSFRSNKDVQLEADLVEEIGRVIGYDNIEPEGPKAVISPVKLSYSKRLSRKIQDFFTLRARGLEIMTYPLIGQKLLEKALWPELNEQLKLVNSLSIDADRMRPCLLPHALEVASLNSKSFSSFLFYELGRSYHADNQHFSTEKNELIICSYSKSTNQMLNTINIVEELLSYCGINHNLKDDLGKFKSEVMPHDWSGLHPHEKLHVQIMGKFKGIIASVHPIILKNFRMKGHLTFAKVDLTDLFKKEVHKKKKYTPIPKFPKSTFDCTVMASEDKKLSSVVETVSKLKIKELISVKIKDVFRLKEGEQAVTVQSTFLDAQATLKSEQLKKYEHMIVNTLENAGFPLKV